MIKLKDIVKLLDRIQMLFTIYIAGEDALPREVIPLYRNLKKTEVDNGEEVFYCKCLGIEHIDAVYRVALSNKTPFGSNIMDYSPSINADIIVTETAKYSTDPDSGEIFPVVFDEYSNLIKIFIPKCILKSEDIAVSIAFIASLISTLFNITVPENISYSEKAKNALIAYFINVVFLFGTFTDIEKIKSTLVFDDKEYQPNMLQSVVNFVEKNCDFNTNAMSEIMSKGIEKFENGDNKFWSDITKDVKFDKIISTIGW